VSKAKKIFLIVGLISVAVGGFALTKWLTRNVKKVRGGVVRIVEYDTPPSEEPLSE
jgi:hypothetical protein